MRPISGSVGPSGAISFSSEGVLNIGLLGVINGAKIQGEQSTFFDHEPKCRLKMTTVTDSVFIMEGASTSAIF